MAGKNNLSSKSSSKSDKGETKRKPSKPSPKKSSLMGPGMFVASVIALLAVCFQSAGMSPLSIFGITTLEAPPDVPQAKAATKEKRPPKRQPSRKNAKPIDPDCIDDDGNCEAWASSGECENNKLYMHANCRASCQVCNGGKPPPLKKNNCADTNENCATWAAIGECQSNPGYMLTQCPVTCKMCQSDTCKDDWDDCAERCRGPATSNFSESWACYYEPELVKKCAWTCGACKEHRFDKPECKRDPDAKQAVHPGDVNKIFQRIVDEVPGVEVLSSEPWVLTIDDFVSSEEADAIIKAGSNSGSSWARSQAGDGVQASRTSSTAWCSGRCLRDGTVQAVEQRVTDLLGGIPMEHAEPMQVLRYEIGQFYKTHHDQNSPRSSAWGPRMFTIFIYVGDGYTGGETAFPRLNLTVGAKKGRAAIWTSILDSDPYQRDDRTDHEALPVESGVKFGVNYWIHMWPFRTKSGSTCGNQAYIQNWY